jgi:hypothetical protein
MVAHRGPGAPGAKVGRTRDTMPRDFCIDYPTRRIYRTGDKTPIEEEHGHCGKGLVRPGSLLVCRAKVIKVRK